MLTLLRYVFKTLIWLVILAGLIVGGLRLTLANINLFRANIETWVAQELAPGIEFSDIRCYWIGINPVLELDQASITLPNRKSSLKVDAISVQFELWDSLVLGTPVVLEILGSIDKLLIRKDINHQWWIDDIHLSGGNKSEAAGDIEEMLAGIPHFIQLELKRLIIEDEEAHRVHQASNLFVNIQHHEQTTHMQMSARLPEALGGLVNLKAQLEAAQGIVYLQTDQLKLNPISSLFDVPLQYFRRVEIAGEAWINLHDHHISGVNGEIRVNKAKYQKSLDDVALPFEFSMRFNAAKQGNNWQLAKQLENLKVSQQLLPDIESQWRWFTGGPEPQLQGWINQLELANYLPVVKPYIPEKYLDLVAQTDIQGRVENFWMNLPVKSPSNLQISAEARSIENQAVDFLPGVNRLDIDLVIAGKQLAAKLSNKGLIVDFRDQFTEPMAIDIFSAQLDAELMDDEAVLSISDLSLSNQDIKVAGRLWLESDFKQRPFLAIHLNTDDGKASQKSRYLPVKVLPVGARKWLDDAIKSGDISNGSILFHGRMQSLYRLDKNRSGELQASFDINNAEILFDPQWHALKQGKAKLKFHNLAIDVELDSASYADIEKVSGQIKIPTLWNTTVLVDIDANALTEIAIPIWLDSPVGGPYRDIAENFEAPGGKASVNLKLKIPISENKKPTVEVAIGLRDGAIKAPVWGVELSSINGKAKVVNDHIVAKGINAKFYQDPIVVDLETDNKKQVTRIEGRGLMDTQQLLNLLPENLASRFVGKSSWQVGLTIANTRQQGENPILTVDAVSSLEGTAVEIPLPFNKVADSRRTTTGRVLVHANNEISFDVDYGNNVKTRGRLQSTNGNNFALADLEVGLGTTLKEESAGGIRIYGKLPKLLIDDWIALYRFEAARQKPGSESLVPLLQLVDLNIDQADLLGREVNSVDFEMIQTSGGFEASISSSAAKGRFLLPLKNTVQNPAVFDLEFINIASRQGESEESGLQPSDFLNMQFRSNSFTYDGRTVSDMEFDTSINESALLIENLRFKHNKVDFASNGYWTYNDSAGEHFSGLQVDIKGSQFGQTMAALDLGDTMRNGTIDFNGEISWPGELLSPKWDILKGKGRLRIDNGILKDVDPGSGRFVGLLSLNALPRRLFLDFSDVFLNGLEFDDIKGDLELDGQSLITKNTRLDGSSARIKIVGTTGLRERDYDQTIYVVPKIRQTLPLIGGIAAGSTVGWGLLLLQNLFKSSIDEAVEFEYSMTGSWDDPVITALNKPEPKKKPRKEYRNLEK